MEGSSLQEALTNDYIIGPCPCLSLCGVLAIKNALANFWRMIPNLVGNFWLPSQTPNAYLKVPLEILGFLDVNRLFKHVKQTLHDSEIRFFPRQFSFKKSVFSTTILPWTLLVSCWKLCFSTTKGSDSGQRSWWNLLHGSKVIFLPRSDFFSTKSFKVGF